MSLSAGTKMQSQKSHLLYTTAYSREFEYVLVSAAGTPQEKICMHLIPPKSKDHKSGSYDEAHCCASRAAVFYAAVFYAMMLKAHCCASRAAVFYAAAHHAPGRRANDRCAMWLHHSCSLAGVLGKGARASI